MTLALRIIAVACLLCTTFAVVATAPKTHHVVTGAAGYLAKELCHMILENACEPVEVLGLVRAARVERESAYWAGLAQGDAGRVQVGDIEQLQQHLARVTSIKGEQDRVV
ncbi:hypothetical protein B484DRAFT_403355, partial [Ochromonadaceae sp. CCMP2298]